MARFHSTYDFLWEVLPEECQILSLELTGNSHEKFKIIFPILTILDYLFLSIKVITSKNKIIFVREYNNFFYFGFIVLALITSKKIFLNVNHNFKTEADFVKKKEALKKFNIYLVLCEYAAFDESPQLYFPTKRIQVSKIQNTCRNKVEDQKGFTIGVIGAYRKEKNIETILKYLSSYKSEGASVLKNCNIVLGSTYDCRSENQKGLIEFIDTTKNDIYLDLLDLVDVAILNYDKSYVFRSSGVLHDIISRRTYCIVPNYPILVSQVVWPAEVGASFDSLDELPDLVEHAIQVLGVGDKNIYESFEAGRSQEHLKTKIFGWCK